MGLAEESSPLLSFLLLLLLLLFFSFLGYGALIVDLLKVMSNGIKSARGRADDWRWLLQGCMNVGRRGSGTLTLRTA
jgi:hypothetical protein